MSTSQAHRVCVVLCFCLIVPAAGQAQARTLCASDNLNNTVVIKMDTDFAAGAIVGLHGWLSIGQVTIPIHGTAVVDAAGAIAKISLQGINNAERHQHLGLTVETDLMLNGSGTFDNVNAGRPFSYEIIAVTWTALDPCPGVPQFGRLGQDAGQTANAGKHLSQTGVKACVDGVSDRAGSRRISRYRCPDGAFRFSLQRRHPGGKFFRG